MRLWCTVDGWWPVHLITQTSQKDQSYFLIIRSTYTELAILQPTNQGTSIDKTIANRWKETWMGICPGDWPWPSRFLLQTELQQKQINWRKKYLPTKQSFQQLSYNIQCNFRWQQLWEKTSQYKWTVKNGKCDIWPVSMRLGKFPYSLVNCTMIIDHWIIRLCDQASPLFFTISHWPSDSLISN